MFTSGFVPEKIQTDGGGVKYMEFPGVLKK